MMWTAPRVRVDVGDLVRTEPLHREPRPVVVGTVTYRHRDGGILIDSSGYWCADREGMCVVLKRARKVRRGRA